MSARGRRAVRASLQTLQTVQTAAPAPLLQFDFAPPSFSDVKAASSKEPARATSIKDAIIRWLDEEL